MRRSIRTSVRLPALTLSLALAGSGFGIARAQTTVVSGDVHPITSLAPRPVLTLAISPAPSLLFAAAEPVARAVPMAADPAHAGPGSTAVSSSRLAESAETTSAGALPAPVAEPAPAPSYVSNVAYRPFSAFAVGVKIGVAGIGFDLATPLAQRFNLRAGASFFQYSGSYNVDGTIVNGEAKLRSTNLSVDWFPFNNRFRISPGVILYNGNNLNALANVPGGQTFELNDQTYTSSSSDPIHGSASLTFGNRTAPSLTIGAGNMIPRHSDSHWSLPFEVGVEYISNPMLTLALAGTACQQGICQNVGTNPQFQANLQAENNDLNNDIHDLRFFPILSLGLAYKFGR